MEKIEDNFAPLRKGMLEFAVLQVISGDTVYVADILSRLEQSVFATSEGTLYPLLSRLKRESLVSYQWAESDSGPPRKYYCLTERGSARLARLHAYWKELYKSLEKLGGTK